MYAFFGCGYCVLLTVNMLCHVEVMFFKLVKKVLCLCGDRGSTVVKVLCYKSVGRWFNPRSCRWLFH